MKQAASTSQESRHTNTLLLTSGAQAHTLSHPLDTERRDETRRDERQESRGTLTLTLTLTRSRSRAAGAM